jgi:chitodextrinase
MDTKKGRIELMKMVKSYILIAAALAALTAGFVGCGHGGSSTSEEHGNGDGVSLSGTAASGAPIASATITLKDKNGSLKTSVTGTDGKYSFDITGMTAPFLIKVPSGPVNLYSVATSSGTANVHPYTDLIIRNWYMVKGSDMDTAFGSTGALPSPPTEADISPIEAAVRNIMKTWLQQEGLDVSSFNLITSSFDADSVGFDEILDNTMVSIDAAGQVTVDSCDPATGIDGTAISTNIVNLAATDTAPPSDPGGLVATGADKNKIVLVWSSSADDISVAGYNIYRDNTEIGKSPFPSYADSSGLQPLTTYCYQIEAFDGAGNVSINKSGQVCTATLGNSDTALPSTPSNLSATAISTSQISLSWTASTDVDNNLLGYKVYRDGNKIESVAVPATSFVDKGLSAHTQYCYTVKAFDSARNISPDSSQACITTL